MSSRRLALPALLLSACLPGSGWADMTADERSEFREEVRAYLLENPDVLNEMVAILDARERDAAAARDDKVLADKAAEIFDDGFSYVRGNPEGDVTVVAFLDYQCTYCKRAHPEVMDLLDGDSGLKVVVKELPILGPTSEYASRAAIATLIVAGPEAYGALNDRLLRHKGQLSEAIIDEEVAETGADLAAVRAAMGTPEVTRRIEATRAVAGDLAIEGTPTFVVGDRLVRGYAPLAAMRDMVADARAGG
ncbi:DsbA family protein [Amaricoccus sp.]|uniref:DsbA family protein n=1 Tax=Amaricoccus sp. TaxID=1872485 RepID=UPI001B6E0C56|nr:DsbA family protein [Amaricoccus sp.]MBP7001103.1 thioredoxin domain-containing protein [Amaricoccus sp.]